MRARMAGPMRASRPDDSPTASGAMSRMMSAPLMVVAWVKGTRGDDTAFGADGQKAVFIHV
jgi:hypothetical protein